MGRRNLRPVENVDFDSHDRGATTTAGSRLRLGFPRKFGELVCPLVSARIREALQPAWFVCPERQAASERKSTLKDGATSPAVAPRASNSRTARRPSSPQSSVQRFTYMPMNLSASIGSMSRAN